jgi:hypothetical protein
MQWLLIGLLVIDLASVKLEPNPEKRSDLALENANGALDRAREASSAGDAQKLSEALNEVVESVGLAYDSLEASGKEARNSRFFKRAEVRTHEMVRRLSDMARAVSLEDQPLIEKVRDRVSEVHDNLLEGIMSKKKK